MAATDGYSFGLLLLRIEIDGRNPFEELNVIPPEWSLKEKETAVRVLKEDDCLHPLLTESLISNKPSPSVELVVNTIACLLLADPVKRMEAMGILAEQGMAQLPEMVENITSLDDTAQHMEELNVFKNSMDRYQSTAEIRDDTTESEEDPDPLDTSTVFTSTFGISLIPDIVSS
jgi:hypothetical protein